LYVEALQLQASLTEVSVPLDFVRAARRRLSFIWCSILAAVALLVVLHLLAAAFQRILLAGRLRDVFDAPPPVEVQSPAADVPAGRTSTDSVSADRASVGRERQGRLPQVPSSHRCVLHLPPATVDRLSPLNVSHDHDRSYHFQFPTTTATQRRSPSVGRESVMRAERTYYTDGILESKI